VGSWNTRRLRDLPVSINVSLCVSGKWMGLDFTERLRRIIPHDNYFTGTYTDCVYDSNFKMGEPEMTYHPVLDTKPYGDQESLQRRQFFRYSDEDILDTDGNHRDMEGSRNKWLKKFRDKSINWHKQILIHNHMMKNIPECDIVIRSRFDAIASEKIDWQSHIQKSHDEEIPIGFNTINIAKNSKRYYHQLTKMQDGAVFYINDALIIHPYKSWDCDLVDELYKNKELKGAEEGWYQILSEPNNHYHLTHVGGVYLEAYHENIMDKDASLHNHSS